MSGMWLSRVAPSHASISEVSRVTNVSATLHIKSPQDWNGILREYRIYYRSHDGARELERTVDLQVSNDTNNDFITEVGHVMQTLLTLQCCDKCTE